MEIWLKRLNRLAKRVHQLLRYWPRGKSKLVFVFGCQRSGTSMLMDVFDADLRSRVYRELDLVFDPHRSMRLRNDCELREIISKERAPIVVVKPLLDSQIASKILESFAESLSIWIFRDFRSVARSNLRRFGNGNGFKDLRPIMSADTSDWRYEAMSSATAQTIRQCVNRGISDIDAAALFWFARNQSFFQQKLDDGDDVFLCSYESLVTDSDSVMRQIYNFMGTRYPGNTIISDIHQASVKRGAGVRLDDEIEAMCDELNQRLVATALKCGKRWSLTE